MMKIDPRKYFSHKQAIRHANQHFFAGRRSLFRDALDGISVEGAAGLIFGERGVGKTSFAWQLLEMFSGNYSLMKHLNVSPFLELNEHHCLWIQCRRSMIDVHGTLLSLLRAGQRTDRTILKTFKDIFSEKNKQDIERTYKFGLPIANATLKFADKDSKVKLSSIPEKLMSELGSRNARIEDLFFEILGSAVDKYRDKDIIIFIDEFDRLPVATGIGEFIKACNDAKIVVVGVADQVEDIITDHESCARKLVGTKFCIPNLNREEVHELFSNVKELSRKSKCTIHFDEEFIDLVFDSSDGYPHHVQLLGFAALLSQLKRTPQSKEIQIFKQNYNTALDELLQGPEGEVDNFELLKTAIADSPNRARILVRMAEHEAGWMQESFAQRVLSKRWVRHFETHVERLEEARVVKRDKATDRIKLATPALRSLIRIAGLDRLMPD